MDWSRERGLPLRVPILVLLLQAVAGCGGEGGALQDARPSVGDGASPRPDALPAREGGVAQASFVAEGCEWMETLPQGGARDGGVADGGLADAPPDGGDAAADSGDAGTRTSPVCVGHAPLTLTFVPIVSGDVDSFVWSFGEQGETPVSAKTPTHTFALPGSYEVALTIGGPWGTLTVRPDPPFVRVLPEPVGWPCDRDEQCIPGMACLCPEETPNGGCPAAFGGRGLCGAACTSDAGCGQGGVCADLGVSAAWRSPMCVASCEVDGACPGGLSCRSLPSGERPGEFVRGCFPAFLGDVGDPCLDADGETRPEDCMGGMCLKLGARGYCTASCEPGGCPEGTACVRLSGTSDGGVCLSSCENRPCSGDPLLACEEPDPTGALGFEMLDPSAPGATYCAPRRCQDETDCEGLPCVSLDGAGFCQSAG